MFINARLALIFILLAIIFTGCSSPAADPVIPGTEAIPPSSEPLRLCLGAYNLLLDPSVPDVTAIPMRSAEKHFNIIPYILPPVCDKCFFPEIIAYDPYGNSYSMKLGLRNYSFYIVYDPRGIIPEAGGFHLINPSGHFKMDYGGPGTPPRYGYIDFDSGHPNRVYYPGTFKEYNLQIAVPEGMHIVQVPFLIDACYPDNCREVYAMEHTGSTGYLASTGGTLTLKYKIGDWQGDVYWVKVDATALDGGWVSFDKTGSDTWEADLHNSLGKGSGVYSLEVAAYSANSLGIVMIDYVDVDVN
jgi:hypothetical protein